MFATVKLHSSVQMAFSIRTVGCGAPGQPPPEHLQVLEGLLRKFVVDTDAYFIQDFQVCDSCCRQCSDLL